MRDHIDQRQTDATGKCEGPNFQGKKMQDRKLQDWKMQDKMRG